MRMSAKQGAAVAFELPSDASGIVLSTALQERLDLFAGGSDLKFKFFCPSYCVYYSAIPQS